MISKIFLNCKSGGVKHYGKKDIESIQSLFPDLEVIYLTSGSPIVPGDVVICMSREMVWDFPVTKVETSDHRPVEQGWFLKDTSVFADEAHDDIDWKYSSWEGSYTYYLGIPKKITADNLPTFEPGTRVANRNGKVFVTAVEQFKDNSFTYCYLEGEKGLYLIPTDELKEVQFDDGFGGKSFNQVWFEESAEVPLDTIKGMSNDVWWVAGEAPKYDVINKPKQVGQSTSYDVINRPRHYMLLEGVEVRDICKVMADRLEDKGYSAMFISDYIQMMQYLLRFDEKNGLEDVKKSKFYLDKLIESEEDHKDD